MTVFRIVASWLRASRLNHRSNRYSNPLWCSKEIGIKLRLDRMADHRGLAQTLKQSKQYQACRGRLALNEPRRQRGDRAFEPIEVKRSIGKTRSLSNPLNGRHRAIIKISFLLLIANEIIHFK